MAVTKQLLGQVLRFLAVLWLKIKNSHECQSVIAILYSQTAADLIPRLLQVHFFWQWACFYWQQQPFSTIRKGQQKVTVNSAFPHCLSLVSRPICSGCVGLNEQRANLAMDNWMVKRLTLNLHEHLCNLGLNPGRTALFIQGYDY